MTLRIVSISVWLQSTIIILPESATSSVVFLAHFNIVNAVHFTAPLSSEKKKRGTD
ncbi:hypothetical protein RO3G_00081 [Rhizopus delemar RA 99-880]|uniref:Uncharacterized protein n=1 Tax=Rhizopus delemar (strain RA 99-880 / ATCC MYA-4621 / FGSC 9543 / NRRL 43880) TaxID=246409 RepID=I1BGP7_RHIO9|nr:hypothetical protein RO3G_00081 [Rhizopus delemar RA 99-880]|eukprot:EIE75377.1 hypothetical protein RO3G_00081 [Rhizopus delemar RA 99-880]